MWDKGRQQCEILDHAVVMLSIWLYGYSLTWPYICFTQAKYLYQCLHKYR